MSKRLSLALTLTILAFPVWYMNVAQAQQLVEQGLISYWSFDKSGITGDTVKDIKGGHDGTIVGSPEIVSRTNKQLAALRWKMTDSLPVPGVR